MEAVQYWLALTLVPGLGPVRILRLVEMAGSPVAAWQASPALMAKAGIDSRTAAALTAAQRNLNPAAELQKVAKYGIELVCWDDPRYPARLREIEYAPTVLYLRGTLTAEDDWGIAIVGTRTPTVYGRDVAGRLSTGLAERGFTVVSGLAKGIDGVAHKAALDAGGRTIAVMGCGLDRIYPAENLRLAHRIVEHGALISEFPVGTKPDAPNFPMRNRIVSGLSRGVLVVEAGDRSGALLTARDALNQNREVFAVPGSITSSMSVGTNRLIQRGEAKLVTGVDDIVDELRPEAFQGRLPLELPSTDDPVEQRVLDELAEGVLHVDDLRERTGLTISAVSSALTMLEIKGLVRSLGGMQYALVRAR